MSEEPMRRTQARTVERERARAQQRRKSTMQKAIPLLLGVLVLLFVAFVALATANNANQETPGTVGPRLQVDREQVDLGHRVFGETVRAVFNVKNAGDGTLKLTTPQMATALEGC